MSDYPASAQVGRWKVQVAGADGNQVRFVHGRLVMQEYNVLIMDPETRAIKFGVPSVNCVSVEPAA